MKITPEQPAWKELLLVDDDDLFRDATQRSLHALYHSATTVIHHASDGHEALDIILQRSIDIVLIDYQMPGGDGLYWLDRILQAKPEQAVIMVTGEGSEEIAVQAMKKGAMDYLVKGLITPESLHRAISNVIEKLRLRRKIRQQQDDLLQAERHRVMIESLAAACHHLGQPATVLLSYLDVLNQMDQTPEHRQMLKESLAAAQSLSEVLQRLQTVATYRTVPYLPSGSGDHQRMLEI